MKQKNLVLLVVAVGCGLAAAFLSQGGPQARPAEEVEVLVAAKNLSGGTRITREMLDKKEITTQAVPRNSIREEKILTPDDLVGKELARSLFKGEMVKAVDLKTGPEYVAGKNCYSIPITAVDAAGGRVRPGSKVDVMVKVAYQGKWDVFPLLVGVRVLEVDGKAEPLAANQSQQMHSVTFAITPDEIAVLALARNPSCTLTLADVNPDGPEVLNHDLRAAKAKLEEALKNARAEGTHGELVKALFATEDIKPGTPITVDLIRTKFVVKEVIRGYAPGTCNDLTVYVGGRKVLKTGVPKGSCVLESMIGDAAVATVATYRDVTFHGGITGTLIHRYEVLPSGEEKFVEILTPAQAADRRNNATKKTNDFEKPQNATEVENRGLN